MPILLSSQFADYFFFDFIEPLIKSGADLVFIYLYSFPIVRLSTLFLFDEEHLMNVDVSGGVLHEAICYKIFFSFL